MEVYSKKCKELATKIETKRSKEREIQDSIEEESKSMEKMANKRAVKLRKVSWIGLHTSCSTLQPTVLHKHMLRHSFHDV